MTTARADAAIRQLAELAGYAAGWDGRGAAAASPGSFVLATAFAVEAAALGLSGEAELHSDGCALLTYGGGEVRASVRFHADGLAGAYLVQDGVEWDGDVRVDDSDARLHLIVRLLGSMMGAARSRENAVAVRRLEWQVDGEGERETFFTDTILGRYVAWERNGRGRMGAPGMDGPAVVGLTSADAKAAAQADFERRVRSALEPG